MIHEDLFSKCLHYYNECSREKKSSKNRNPPTPGPWLVRFFMSGKNPLDALLGLQKFDCGIRKNLPPL